MPPHDFFLPTSCTFLLVLNSMILFDSACVYNAIGSSIGEHVVVRACSPKENFFPSPSSHHLPTTPQLRWHYMSLSSTYAGFRLVCNFVDLVCLVTTTVIVPEYSHLSFPALKKCSLKSYFLHIFSVICVYI